MSLAVFSSCEKDEFTEADALDLELMRLRAEDSIQAAQEARNIQNTIALEQYRRSVDSLRNIDQGGMVFYSVAVVPGGSSAFGQGRYDEVQGLSGATVTISQYGNIITSPTDESGVATFAGDAGDGLRSGEATVNVTVDGFTDASYVVNLTPDGGVANDGVQYVGNVVPVFENDADNPDNVERMAMISGIGWAELDLTNNFEETVPEGVTLSAVIDVDTDAFMDRYIREPNAYDEGQNDNELPTRSGFIQRIAYEEASEVAAYDQNGEYSMMVSATAAGLPMKLQYSDFAEDRFYYRIETGEVDGTDESAFDRPRFDGDTSFFTPVSKRHIYGPNVDWRRPFVTGAFFASFAEFDLRERDANIEATLTSDGRLWTIPDHNDLSVQALVVHPAAVPLANASSGDSDLGGFDADEIAINPNALLAGGAIAGAGTPGITGGEYLADGNYPNGMMYAPGTEAPANGVVHAVEFVGGDPTTPATGYAVFSNAGEDTDGASADFDGGTDELNGTQLRRVVRIVVTNPGEGYTSAPAVNIVRENTVVTGTGDIVTDIVSGTTITEVRLIDGGYGFTPNNGNTSTREQDRFEEGEWIAEFNDADPAASGDYSLAYGIDPHINYPSADVSGVNLDFKYDFEITDGDDDLGVVQTIEVVNGGSGWDDASIAALNLNPFRYWLVEAVVPIADGEGNDLFVITAGTGLNFNTDWRTDGGAGGAPYLNQNATSIDPSVIGPGEISPTAIDFSPATAPPSGGETSTFDGTTFGFQEGDEYVFVPGVRIEPADGDPVTAPAEIVCEMNGFGQLREFRIVSSGNGYTAQPLRVEFVPTDNDRVDAVFFTTGGSINTYAIDDDTDPIPGDHAVGSFVEDKWQTLDTDDLDPEENSYWVSFSDPSLDYGFAAYGVPVFDETDTDDAPDLVGGDIVRGVEILDAGLGYTPDQEITWEIRTIGADGTDADDANLVSFISPSELEFNIVDGGLGYAVRPDIFVVGGNVNLDDENAPDPSDFDLTFNNAGEIVSLSFSGINPYTLANVADDPLQVIVTVEDQVQFMNDFWNGDIDYLATPAYGPGAGFAGLVGLPAGSGSLDGNCDAITGFDYNLVGVSGGAAAFIEASASDFFNEMENQANNGYGVPFVGGNGTDVDDDDTAGPGTGEDGEGAGYITPPTVELFGLGTGATAEVVLNLATGDIQGITVTNGGSGYECVFTNDPSMEPEPFRVIGGPDGNTVDADDDGMADYFEVYSGIQYVRDIHYGTGEEVE